MGHSLIRSLAHSHRSLVRSLRTARCARALRCAHSFTRSLTHSLLSSWDSGIFLSNFQDVLNHCAGAKIDEWWWIMNGNHQPRLSSGKSGEKWEEIPHDWLWWSEHRGPEVRQSAVDFFVVWYFCREKMFNRARNLVLISIPRKKQFNFWNTVLGIQCSNGTCASDKKVEKEHEYKLQWALSIEHPTRCKLKMKSYWIHINVKF